MLIYKGRIEGFGEVGGQEVLVFIGSRKVRGVKSRYIVEIYRRGNWIFSFYFFFSQMGSDFFLCLKDWGLVLELQGKRILDLGYQLY